LAHPACRDLVAFRLEACQGALLPVALPLGAAAWRAACPGACDAGAWDPCPPSDPSREACWTCSCGVEVAVRKGACGASQVFPRLRVACRCRRAEEFALDAWRRVCCHHHEAFAGLLSLYLCLCPKSAQAASAKSLEHFHCNNSLLTFKSFKNLMRLRIPFYELTTPLNH
jgi:hypothetical protein